MRAQFTKTIESIIDKNKSIFIILGDIGVFGFRNIFKNYPKQIINIGILEQATISFAAGLSKMGLIPIVHTIAPFLVERAIEQIKIDFGYQNLRGNLVSVGASYDYASLGSTHHCPADINLIKNIPNVEIVVPGTSDEFDTLFRSNYANNNLTYFRLSEYENNISYNVKFGKANIIKRGKKATIIVVGPVIKLLKQTIENLDANILYYTTISPFDSATLKKVIKKNEKIILIEPYYSGSLYEDIFKKCSKSFFSILNISVPIKFIHKYGNKNDIDNFLGFTEKKIRKKIEKFINEK